MCYLQKPQIVLKAQCGINDRNGREHLFNLFFWLLTGNRISSPKRINLVKEDKKKNLKLWWWHDSICVLSFTHTRMHTQTQCSWRRAEPGQQHHTKHLLTSTVLSAEWPPSASLSLCVWLCALAVRAKGWQRLHECVRVHPACARASRRAVPLPGPSCLDLKVSAGKLQVSSLTAPHWECRTGNEQGKPQTLY